MKFSFSLFALVSASAASAAATLEKRVTYYNATATEFTVSSSSFCLGSTIPAATVAKTQSGINSGYYIAVPGPIDPSECGLSGAWRSVAAAATKLNNIIIADVTTDGTIKISPLSWAVGAPGAGVTSFDATYFVSNSG